MRFRYCLYLFVVTLLCLTARAQQKSESKVVMTTTPSLSPAPVKDRPGATSVVRQSEGGPSVRPFTIFGVGGRASTLGMGLQAATNLTPRSNLRVGFSSLSWPGFSHSGISYNGESSLKSVDAVVDYFVAGNFRVSPGVLLYFGNIVDAKASVAGGHSFNLGDVTYTSDPANPLKGTGKLTTNKVAPVFMFGYGNLVPRTKHFSVSFDLGVAYQGTPKAALDFSGNVCQLGVCQSVTAASVQNNVQAEIRKLEHTAAPFRLWPIVSISIGYRFGGAH